MIGGAVSVVDCVVRGHLDLVRDILYTAFQFEFESFWMCICHE